MNVLKFGGTSVANAKNIKLVCDIVADRAAKERCIVVVSAFGGVTDQLLDAAHKAENKDQSYKNAITDIENRHVEAIHDLIPVTAQPALLEQIKKHLESLATLLDGCFLLGELSQRTSDSIAGFGELLSSVIIAEAIKTQFPDTGFKDSRELIKTNDRFGKATVNFELTNSLIWDYFNHSHAKVTVIPGFVASSTSGFNTTLGRGGS